VTAAEATLASSDDDNGDEVVFRFRDGGLVVFFLLVLRVAAPAAFVTGDFDFFLFNDLFSLELAGETTFSSEGGFLVADSRGDRRVVAGIADNCDDGFSSADNAVFKLVSYERGLNKVLLLPV